MCKAMIITVGGTLAPIIKSVCEYRPDFVSFFASQDTSDAVKTVKDEVLKKGIIIKSELTLADNVNDLFHCHKKAEETVQRVLAREYDKNEVIVDYTGGTKTMSVSLALATINHGFLFSYVGGSERTKDGVGIVVDGKETIYQSINPWDFLALEERKKIALLFNQYQFKAAKDLTDGLAEKRIKKSTSFKKLGFLIEGYYKWDLFRHKEARDHFKRAKIDELLEEDDEFIRIFAQETKKRLNFLENIIADGNSPSLNFILDMYSNAERRFEGGGVDDAILRLYRIIEMGAQERLLNRYGIDASDIKAGQIPRKLLDRFIKDYKNDSDGRIKIPQTAAFELLDALDDDLGKLFQEKKSNFLKVQHSRNHSYLAHGFESSKEGTYISLKNIIIEFGIFKPDEAPVFPKMDL